MEALTRLVTESLARHGFDRPLDYRRLHWSRWFRCESPHSLLFVPSKPGVFAVAEEIADFGTTNAHVATGASQACPEPSRRVPQTLSEAKGSGFPQSLVSDRECPTPDAQRPMPAAECPTPAPRRLLAVTQFFEDDDMAFVLDRMLSRENPMRARLLSGRYFVRFVVIEDESQRRSVCAALNQWMANTAEKATGIGPHFATSLELTPATEHIQEPNAAQQSLFDDANKSDQANVARTCLERESKGPSPASARSTNVHVASDAAPHLDSGAASNLHCPSPLPSGF